MQPSTILRTLSANTTQNPPVICYTTVFLWIQQKPSQKVMGTPVIAATGMAGIQQSMSGEAAYVAVFTRAPENMRRSPDLSGSKRR